MGSEQPLVHDREALWGASPRPLDRDQQLEEIRSCIEVGRTFRPGHAWLSGPAGSGKTFCARHVVDNLAKRYGFRVVWVNCAETFTFLAVVERILEVVRPLRSVARVRDVQLAVLRSAIEDRPSVIVLDDIDMLRLADMTELLRHLCVLPCTAVVGIAATTDVLRRLPEAVRSRLTPRLIKFPAYHPAELRDILVDALHRSLRPGGWTEAIVDKIVDRAHGDARRMLGLLRHAVTRAEHAGVRTLDAHHLQVVNSTDFSSPTSADPLAFLTSHHRLLVDVVWQQGPIATSALELAFRQACDLHGMEPIARRTLVKYLGLLCQRRVLERERSPAERGFRYRVVA